MCNKSEGYFAIYCTSVVCSCISAISCILLLIILHKNKQIQGPSVKLLRYMSIIDLIRASIFFGPYSLINNSYYCNYFSIIINGTLTSNSVWSLYIAKVLYQLYTEFPEKPNNSLKFWIIFAFIVAPVYQILPLMTDSYGFNEGFCTYKNNTADLIWRGFQEGLIFIITCFGVALYFIIYSRFLGIHFYSLRELMFDKGMIYSVIYFVIIAVVLVFRFAELSMDFCDSFPLAIIAYTLISLHGFFNAICVFFNRNFRFLLRSRSRDHKESLDSIIGQVVD